MDNAMENTMNKAGVSSKQMEIKMDSECKTLKSAKMRSYMQKISNGTQAQNCKYKEIASQNAVASMKTTTRPLTSRL